MQVYYLVNPWAVFNLGIYKNTRQIDRVCQMNMGISKIITSKDEAFISSQLKALKEELGISDKNISDYFELRTQKKRSIGVEETRDLKSWANLKPFSAPFKLAVIFDAQVLTPEAQNSLLKLIEE